MNDEKKNNKVNFDQDIEPIIRELEGLKFTGDGMTMSMFILKDVIQKCTEFLRFLDTYTTSMMMTVDPDDKEKAKDVTLQVIDMIKDITIKKINIIVNDVNDVNSQLNDEKAVSIVRKIQSAKENPEYNPMQMAAEVIKEIHPGDPKKQAEAMAFVQDMANKIGKELAPKMGGGLRTPDTFNLLD